MAQEKGIGWRSRGGVDMLTKPTRRCFAGGEEGELQGENRGVESSIRSGSRALAKPARPGLAPAATSTVRRGWCPRRCTEQRRKAVAMPQDDASGVYGCRESGGKQEEGWHDPGRTTAARQGVCNACAWCRSAGIEEGERKEMSCLAWKLGKMAALGRRLLLQPLPLLAQQALCRAVPPPIPHCCFLHSCFPPAAAASPSPPAPASPSLSGSAGSLLPTSAGAVVVAAPGNGSLGLEQRGGTSGWLLSSSALLLHAAPWAHWATTPADDTVFMLIGANVSVFMLWRLLAYPRFITGPYMISLDMFFAGRLHTLLTSAFSHVDPMFMMKHFTISLDNFMSRRLHTLLTSAFSHMDVQHLFNNMVGLYFFGSSIARMFGPAFLLQLYVTGALTGSAFYLAEMIFLAPRKQGFGGWKTPCLGASAAVNATILLEIFLHPTKLLYLHFFIPVPAALVGVGLIGADLWRVKKGQSRVSGSSHLGGALVAAVAFAEIKGWI